eukprot:Rmarinus@m.23528
MLEPTLKFVESKPRVFLRKEVVLFHGDAYSAELCEYGVILSRSSGCSQLLGFCDTLCARSDGDVLIVDLMPRRDGHRFLLPCSMKMESKLLAAQWANATNSILSGLPIGATPTRRRIYVFINPFGGMKKAVEIFESTRSVFERCPFVEIHELVTAYQGHAAEVARVLNPDDVDGIVCVSGDGLMFEIQNAFLERDDWDRCRKIPMGMIAAGTGNGLAASVDAVRPMDAAFNICRGSVRPLDAYLICQGQKRYIGFLQYSSALIGDCDIESESYRWMGPVRSTLGAIICLAKGRSYPGRLAIKISRPVDDQGTQNVRQTPECSIHCTVCDHEPNLQYSYEGVPLRSMPLTVDEALSAGGDWRVIESSFSLFTATNTKLIASDCKIGTHAHLADGHLDVVLVRKERSDRTKMFSMLLGLESGTHTAHRCVEYYKAQSIVFEPTGDMEGIMTVDGERIDYGSFAMDVLPSCFRTFVSPNPDASLFVEGTHFSCEEDLNETCCVFSDFQNTRRQCVYLRNGCRVILYVCVSWLVGFLVTGLMQRVFSPGAMLY